VAPRKIKAKTCSCSGCWRACMTWMCPSSNQCCKPYYKSKGDDVIRNVIGAFNAGYGYDIGRLTDTFKFVPSTNKTARKQVVTDGNQAIAYGALAAGIRFGAGYPITPWSSVMEILRANCPSTAESLSRRKTNWPPLRSLAVRRIRASITHGNLRPRTLPQDRSAGLGRHGRNADCHHRCPAWWSEHRSADQRRAERPQHRLFWWTRRFPRIVLAPSSVEDCFYVTLEAAKLAREYSCPAIVLTDQALATRVETWEMPDIAKLMQDLTPDFAPRGPNYKAYQNTVDGIAHHAPPGTPMLDGKYPVVTGLEHDETGHPASRPANHVMMVAKRRRKLQVLASRLPKAETYGPPRVTSCWSAGDRRTVRSAKRWTKRVPRAKASAG